MKKIMFNDELSLTQSVLDGIKKQTRRIINDSVRQSPFVPSGWETIHGYEVKPMYKIGEVIAIAQRYKDVLDFLPEAFRRKSDGYISSIISTSAGLNNKMFVRAGLMPHKIKITNIRIEKLQDISDEDCLKEGVVKREEGGYIVNGMDRLMPHGNAIAQQVSYYYEPIIFDSAREAFAGIINKINGKGTWDSNPYVFVYEFELIN